MSERNYQKVPVWKIYMILMLVVWMINLLMSFVYKSQISFFMFNWMTDVFLSLIETLITALLVYIFYLMFFRKRKGEDAE
jgi:uncharacterized protein YacL